MTDKFYLNDLINSGFAPHKLIFEGGRGRSRAVEGGRVRPKAYLY